MVYVEVVYVLFCTLNDANEIGKQETKMWTQNGRFLISVFHKSISEAIIARPSLRNEVCQNSDQNLNTSSSYTVYDIMTKQHICQEHVIHTSREEHGSRTCDAR